MAAQVPRSDTQNSAEQYPQVSGAGSESSTLTRMDLNLTMAPPIPLYNPPISSAHQTTGSPQPNNSNRSLAPPNAHREHDNRHLRRRLPHVRQRIRRRNRANRAHMVHINTLATHMAYRNREHSNATSITGSVTSGPIVQTSLQMEGSQERLARLMSALPDESSSIRDNFECNICFQKANEAVVTCCGHLFCWPCLYVWLHVHSCHKECPVCKGSVVEYSVTPIYGRDDSLTSATLQGTMQVFERIPPRPSARRIESTRQREREERVQEQEIEAREIIDHIENADSEVEQAAPENVGATGVQENLGVSSLTQHTTIQRRNEIFQEGGERLPEMGRNEGGRGGRPQSNTVQRRLYYRRERLRQALAVSQHIEAMNHDPRVRDERRQQLMVAAALLSQEWEHIINVRRLVVNPAQAAEWLAAMHARLEVMEREMQTNPHAANTQHRRQVLALATTYMSLHQPQQDAESVSRLVTDPLQSSDWIVAMRTRLRNIEQIMRSLEPHPNGEHTNIQSSSSLTSRNPNPPLGEDHTPEVALAPSEHSVNLVVVLEADENEEGLSQATMHGNTNSGVHDQLPITQKRRRRD